LLPKDDLVNTAKYTIVSIYLEWRAGEEGEEKENDEKERRKGEKEVKGKAANKKQRVERESGIPSQRDLNVVIISRSRNNGDRLVENNRFLSSSELMDQG